MRRSWSRNPGAPAVPALFALAAGTAAALVAAPFAAGALLAALVLVCVAGIFASRTVRGGAGLAGALVLCALAGYLRGRHAVVEPALEARALARALPPDAIVRVTGRLAAPWSSSGSLRTARLEPDEASVDGRAVRLRAPLSVVVAGETDPTLVAGLGDRVRVEGAFRLPDRLGRPPFPFALPPQPRLVLKSALQVERLGGPRGPLGPVLALHDGLHRRIASYSAGLPRSRRDAVALAEALLLGETAGVSQRVTEAFRDGGVAHVLSISGLHVALVVAFLSFLLHAAPLAVGTRDALLLVSTFAFAAFAGGRPPVLRAALMIGLYLGARLVGRPTGIGQVIGLSAFVLLLADPGNLLDLGYLLTYGAVFGILTLGVPAAGWLERGGVRPRALAQGIGATAGAELAVLPIQAAAFHVVPFVSLISNLLVVPLASVFLWCALVLMPFLALSARSAALASIPLGFIAELLLGILGALDNLGAFRLVASPAPILTLALAAAVLVAGLSGRALRGAALGAVAILAIVVLVAPARRAAAGTVELRAIDVGQGDAWLFVTPSGRVLVDGGGTVDPEYAFGRLRLLPKLADLGALSFDTVVLTHPHPDHTRGLVGVLTLAPVGRLVLADGCPRGMFLDEVLEAAARRGVPVERRFAGERFSAAGLNFEVLHPGDETYPRAKENNVSLVLRVAFGGRRVLLTGDIEALAERDLVARIPDLRADVLKIPHHGSRTSSTPLFLDAVRPRVALVGVGRRNPYGHPAASVLERYAERGVRVFRTDRDGDVGLLFARGRILPHFAEELPE